jgi:hypothetical protein
MVGAPDDAAAHGDRARARALKIVAFFLSLYAGHISTSSPALEKLNSD